ncbi:DUF2075 domain-containing protein [Gammaproteobacteria bacterium]|nr:DUF2075 domain-containing protein [Gammaproteobacteria bacterium]
MSQAGFHKQLADFCSSEVPFVIDCLKAYVPDAGQSQVRAWRDSIKILISSLCNTQPPDNRIAESSAIIFEYTIPLESRRIDAVLLLNGVIVVVEFKGKPNPSRADIDQAAAYARDLRAYHRACESPSVKCLLVLTGAQDLEIESNGVDIIDASKIIKYCRKVLSDDAPAPDIHEFLSLEAYQPLPSLIKAARELFTSGSLKRIHRAAVATEPTLDKCSEIIHKTARSKRRSLILISGVPGAGKTLVGLQLAHAKYLDDLSTARPDGSKPTAAAVFLSGNGPLVEVLQYELRSAGGDGKAFVRGVHEYVKTFTKSSAPIPPQHVLIYDEAQRAFDSEQVQAKHRDLPPEFVGISEPELFIQFAERVPDWCVVVGLIGTGQEIHIGEEAGIAQWAEAIKKAKLSNEWDVYIPDENDTVNDFKELSSVNCFDVLCLSESIRFHLATRLYEFVKCVLDGEPDSAKAISLELEKNGYNLRLTHDLAIAKEYLNDRYQGNDEARYGLIASSRDKDLKNHGIPKGFKSRGEAGPGKFGKWYTESKGVEGACTNLDVVVTEFGAQGLELDSCLLAWGTDFIRANGEWDNSLASGYRDAHRIVDALLLRKNAYRVLLTRGRDSCVIFIPPIPDKMRETYQYLVECGFTDFRDL